MSIKPEFDQTSQLLPRLREGGYDRERVARRRRWLEKRTGATLHHAGSFSVDSESMRGNIENPIGVAQVPLGAVGPLLVRGEFASGTFYVPMATSEGALIRSYERGVVALTRAGGVETSVVRDRNQISPSFFFPGLGRAKDFVHWVESRIDEIRDVAEKTTRHGKLRKIECHQYGAQVVVNFEYATGDAQGMNMIVRATDEACRWIADRVKPDRYFLFSGMCSEKRPSGYLLSRGKGKWATARAHLPESILRPYLNCSALELYEVWHSTLIGHLAAGSVGYNGMFANGLAAMFIALGQDVANIVNSSCGVTDFQLDEDGLDVQLTLPALSVATVGGGTALGTQRECLEMIGCYGSGNSGKLAEIVAATLLGGEVSMGAAIASGEFAEAHERYGRNRPGESE